VRKVTVRASDPDAASVRVTGSTVSINDHRGGGRQQPGHTDLSKPDIHRWAKIRQSDSSLVRVQAV